ncbi:MAG TPA: hypothetical protein VEU62_20375 [Bryobacterales bacterium]|nr:hypothetical protein [Bryobacterales bacterium]
MKRLVLVVAMACQFAPVLPQAMCQEQKIAARKLHLLVTGPGGGSVSALSIERGVPYPSVIHLKGDVEIRRRGMILRADEADYHEDSGEVGARGHVRVMPYPVEAKN